MPAFAGMTNVSRESVAWYYNGVRRKIQRPALVRRVGDAGGLWASTPSTTAAGAGRARHGGVRAAALRAAGLHLGGVCQRLPRGASDPEIAD